MYYQNCGNKKKSPDVMKMGPGEDTTIPTGLSFGRF
jgi:hypothetical protein